MVEICHMFEVMKKEALNYLIKLIPKSKQPLEQGTTMYQVTAVE